MDRREFLKMLAVLGVGAAFPFGVRNAIAAGSTALPVPGLLRPDAAGRIGINIMAGQSQWRRNPTQTWGYNGPLLGPAISLRRGEKVVMDVRNSLEESTALHWHGLEIPGVSDGGPQAAIEPGGLWTPELTIDQGAATCWFHPHSHGKTGKQVAMGLGGLLLIEDENSDKLALPRTWGVDDIPVILQDKRLNERDQIDYSMDVVSASVGWFGDMLLTNGTLYPEHAAPGGWLRLRLLNGCNARSLRLAFSDNRPMYVIASDGGFLPEPVKLNELTLFMGERFEVLVDASDGKPFDLVSLPVRQMGMTLAPFDAPLPALRITPTGQAGHKILPDSLVPLAPLPVHDKLPVRHVHLSMNHMLDMQGMGELQRRYGSQALAGMGGHMMNGGMMSGNNSHMGGMMGTSASDTLDLWTANKINGEAFKMGVASFDVPLGQYERWIISGKGDMMLHPFHIHGTQFRILKENGATPPPHRQGLKDTVFVEGGESEVIVRFMHPAPKERMFMAHCHLLEHEDTGMMMAFTVSK